MKPAAQNPRTVRLAAPLTDSRELHAMEDSLKTGWLTQGPRTREFEDAFSTFQGVGHSVAVSSGTTALHLALLALGVGPGDEVVVPSFTWVACANAVAYTGARPVFADVDRATYNSTPDQVAACISDKTRVVMVVHQFGQCADVDAIADAVPDGVLLMEDAATAVGSTLRGRLAGTLTKIATYSFHPRKILTTGEGGMVFTRVEELADKVAILRNHGADPSITQTIGGMAGIAELGFNYRITEMQAAIGLVQLERLSGMIDERRRWAAWYLDRLAGLGWLELPRVDADREPVWQAFVVKVKRDAPLSRDEVAERLAEVGIETRPGTHSSAHLEIYRDQGADCPNSLELEETSLAIPLHNRMTEADYSYVLEALSRVT